ncbi:MAG: four helix bundle protein [Nanoarchaeota archaeon]|nr:four helix bundle protein [Nanoarchaeota archaeon]
MVRDFKELNVWRESFGLIKDVYMVVAKFPREEIYSLSSQLKRATVSVSSNIAEGCGKRTDKDFVGFLYMAMGSVREVECQLMIANNLGYMNNDELEKLLGKVNKLAGMLMKFIHYISSEGDL